MGGTKKKLFTVDDISLIKQDVNLSNRQMKILAEGMRAASGSRHLIEKSVAEKLEKQSSACGHV